MMNRNAFLKRMGVVTAGATLLAVAPEQAVRAAPPPLPEQERDQIVRDLIYGLVDDNQAVIARAQRDAGMATPGRYRPRTLDYRTAPGWYWSTRHTLDKGPLWEYVFPTSLWAHGLPRPNPRYAQLLRLPDPAQRLRPGQVAGFVVLMALPQPLIVDHDPTLGRLVDQMSWVSMSNVLTARDGRLSDAQEIGIAASTRGQYWDTDGRVHSVQDEEMILLRFAFAGEGVKG